MPNTQEVWKPIKGFEGLYEVSNIGRVKSLKRTVYRNGRKTLVVPEKIISGSVYSVGYCMMKLRYNGIPHRDLLHRIVAEHFIPNPENKPQVNHINGIKTDNRVDNLEWVTRSENQIHAYDIGLQEKGENHGRSKLTTQQVLEIAKSQSTCRAIARDYGISAAQVSRIKTGKSWKQDEKTPSVCVL